MEYNDDSDFEDANNQDSPEPLPAENIFPNEPAKDKPEPSSNQRFASRDTNRFSGAINLGNFDPFKPSQRLDSPRSLEVCLSNGIDVQSLYHKSYDHIKGKMTLIVETCPPLQRNNNEYIMMKYINAENKRIELVKQLQKLRERLICKDNSRSSAKAGDVKYSTNFSKVSNVTNSSMKSIKGSLRATKELDPEVIKEEKRKAIANTAKELKGIIGKIRSEYMKESTYKENSLCATRKARDGSSRQFRVRNNDRSAQNSSDKSARGDKERRHKSFIEGVVQNREQRACQRISEEQAKIVQWRKNQNRLMRSRKIVREIESESGKDRQVMMRRIEEYKRQKLLERIHKHDERAQILQEQRIGLNRLRQEMRKNVAYNKYQAKLELERITKKLGKDEAQGNSKLIGKMLKAAGLGNAWNLASHPQPPKLSNSSQSPKDLSKLDIYMNLPNLTNG
eukprot:TRINITY_DN13241_c0_g2_i1.p1 TRINITY_DN13241_c0_g2~~TRINITY_DN13241_c0_g2_i1.p1  ORF type:complete len:451 (+),score=89.09 TRINITY_DN13241_c0_g2_i1:102-1454(+)